MSHGLPCGSGLLLEGMHEEPTASVADSVPPPPFFNLRVLRNAGIVYLLSYLGGVFSSLMGYAITQRVGSMAVVFIMAGTNIISILIGGFICARSTKGQPLASHLTAVGLLLWASGLINVAMGWINIWQWLPQPILIALCLAFGAWMSSLLKGEQKD
jgi:hypothetical protein